MRLLSSVAIVVLVASLSSLAAGRTLGLFTGTGDASGQITAADLTSTITVWGNAPGVLTFVPASAGIITCYEGVLPGDTCADADVQVHNASGVTFHIDDVDLQVTGGGPGCDPNLVLQTDGGFEADLLGMDIPPGQFFPSSPSQVTLKLRSTGPNAATNDCQGRTFTATLTVTGHGEN